MFKRLLSQRALSACLMLAGAFSVAQAADIHVATTGSDGNAGTEAAPLATIHKAMELVRAGDRILVHEGTYYITERIKIPELPTTPDQRCELRAWPEDAVGKVIIDGSQMSPATANDFKMARCIYVNHLANYWTFYGLTLQHAKDNGMKMEGSYNIVERCVFRYNNDTGLQIGMFKDFSIEETKSFPISGTPQYNPGYSYCRYNKVINCDSYENADLKTFSGSDDGGDADGFACKLFPGPGTEFHGCRAWNNSDDNWDLYMVYHPVVIDHCWAWHAGYYTNASGQVVEGVNGNGFKLGGGGSAGGAAFDQSTGAHVVTNCVSFENLHKGFDQNNAYEGMYIINCTAWGNEYNYRFPTIFKYGGMTLRNCVGWGATAMKSGRQVGNHEFLSPDKDGYQDPDTKFCSWIEIDGCSPIKESYKPSGQDYTPQTQDHSGEFLSLSSADFLADREADGSLPNNNFARLKAGSIFKDKGTPIVGYTPARKMTEAECTAVGLEYITADDLYIPYNDAAPDLGAFELDGTPADVTVPEKIELTCKSANSSQEVVEGQPIAPITYEWSEAGTSATVEGLAEGLTYTTSGRTLTISGTPQTGCTFKVTVSGDQAAGVKDVTTTGIITLVTPFQVLTGDWYHFQDAWDALPADLQGVIELIAGSSNTTSYDPAKTESDGSVPGGCTAGGIDMGKNNGGIRWNLANGVLQLKVNLHFTGDRTFKVQWTLADGTTGSKTTDKMKKTTLLAYDLVEVAGLSESVAKQVRTIELLNTSSSGGARVYDMYVRVPASGTTAIAAPATVAGDSVAGPARKVLAGGRLLIVKDGVRYNLQGQVIE